MVTGYGYIRRQFWPTLRYISAFVWIEWRKPQICVGNVNRPKPADAQIGYRCNNYFCSILSTKTTTRITHERRHSKSESQFYTHTHARARARIRTHYIYNLVSSKACMFYKKRRISIQYLNHISNYNEFLDAFAKLRKAAICFVMSVCLSVCPSVRPAVRMEQLGFYWTGFHEIWHLRILGKSGEKIQVSLKSDKSNGHFIWWPMQINDITLNSS
jgi:hypothetical protein